MKRHRQIMATQIKATDIKTEKPPENPLSKLPGSVFELNSKRADTTRSPDLPAMVVTAGEKDLIRLWDAEKGQSAGGTHR